MAGIRTMHLAKRPMPGDRLSQTLALQAFGGPAEPLATGASVRLSRAERARSTSVRPARAAAPE